MANRFDRSSRYGFELAMRLVASHYGINLFNPECFSGFSHPVAEMAWPIPSGCGCLAPVKACGKAIAPRLLAD